jgi:hypothetical protein
MKKETNETIDIFYLAAFSVIIVSVIWYFVDKYVF